MPMITPELVAHFPKNGPTDPIEYYRRPVTGWLFRERINMGLRMLGQRRFVNALEIGYGSGAVMSTLGESVGELHGIDLDADPEKVHAVLKPLNIKADLRQGSVYELPYETDQFDLALSFSTFEHLHEFDKGLAEVARVLRPKGLFLLGMPSVNKLMEAGFLAIGFKGINDHHVTTPAQVAARFAAHGLTIRQYETLTLPIPSLPGAPVYHNWLLEKSV